MTAFPNASLAKLHNPKLLLQVATTIYEQALELISRDEIPRHYIASEIYEPGIEKTSPDGRCYYEISCYSDGFGSSLFILGDQMLLLASNHEYTSPELMIIERKLYLQPLIAGLPEDWNFVVSILETEERFQDNAPSGVFWFKNDEWHITSMYEDILNALPESVLSSYNPGLIQVDEVDLSYLFSHSSEDKVNQELLKEYFEEWKF